MIPGVSPFTYTPTEADWSRIVPVLLLLGTVLLVLLADLATPPRRKGWLALIGLGGTLAAGAATVVQLVGGDQREAFYGMVASDAFALAASLVVLVALAAGLLLSPGYIERQGIAHVGEYYALLLLAGLGMVLMSIAANLLMVFAGLELLSLALYVLCAMVARRPGSQEAGMKYFLLSSFASAFLLYGMALAYGATGTTHLASMRAFLAAHPFSATAGFGPLLLAGLGLMAVGFCFKVAAIPFHAWTPEVYVGAPTSVTAFMSVGTKVAAFAALLRIFVYALGDLTPQWMPIFWLITVLTLVGGNLMAVAQRDVKRLLAYSSIANAGYLLIAVVTGTANAVAGLLFYLAAYAVMNIGAFAVVLAVERDDGRGTTLEDFAGLARRRPALAAAMLLFLLALAGVPPTVGFWAKWYVFYAAVVGSHTELALLGAVSSLLGMYYYLRVVWAMYFSEARPASEAAAQVPAPDVRPASVGEPRGGVAVAERRAAAQVAARPERTAPTRLPLGTVVALAVLALLTLGLGLVPGPLSALAQAGARALFP